MKNLFGFFYSRQDTGVCQSYELEAIGKLLAINHREAVLELQFSQSVLTLPWLLWPSVCLTVYIQYLDWVRSIVNSSEKYDGSAVFTRVMLC